MKTMLFSDFAQVKQTLVRTLFICVFVMAIMVVSTGSTLVGAAAVAAMVPYMTVYSVLANDEVAGWSKLRDTLPLSRHDIVLGRYAGTLILTVFAAAVAFVLAVAAGALLALVTGNLSTGLSADVLAGTAISGVMGASVSLVLGSIILPIVMRFGLTRTARILPVAFVVLFCAALGLTSSGGFLVEAQSVDLGVLVVGAVAASLAIYAVSAFIACKLYEAREF